MEQSMSTVDRRLDSLQGGVPEAGSSVPTRPLCTVCNHNYSIYTCPRCATRTCSLSCSTSHKANAECSGEREKVKYVPMNQYGWGTMMNDYTFLEDVGRRVGDWGREIVRGGFDMKGTGGARDGRSGRGRGRGRGGSAAAGRTKRDALKVELEMLDIDMDLLPVGMERRKLNQSVWDAKSGKALLTIEFKFCKPEDPLAPASQPKDPPFVLLTHRNKLDTPLLQLVQTQILERSKQKTACPSWLKSLVLPDSDDPDAFHPPQFVMMAQLDPIARLSAHPVRSGYYKFDPTQPLATLLQGTHFVEFPTIELWEEFRGPIVDKQGIVQHDGEERRPKRRKLSHKAGREAINGLLGDYGSDGEDSDTSNGQPTDLLTMLGGYAGSDDDNEVKVASGDIAWVDAGNSDTEDDEVEDLEPAALLELVQRVQGSKQQTQEYDLVDWGDSGEDELHYPTS